MSEAGGEFMVRGGREAEAMMRNLDATMGTRRQPCPASRVN